MLQQQKKTENFCDDKKKQKIFRTKKMQASATQEMIAFEQIIRDTTATINEAKNAVQVLSNDWVQSDAAAWGQRVGVQTPAIRACKLTEPERQQRANAIQIRIERLEALLADTREAQFEVSVSAFKVLGTYAHGQWLSHCQSQSHYSKPEDTDGEQFLFPTAM